MARLGPPMSAAYSKDISPMPAKCLVTATFSPYVPGGRVAGRGSRKPLGESSRTWPPYVWATGSSGSPGPLSFESSWESSLLSAAFSAFCPCWASGCCRSVWLYCRSISTRFAASGGVSRSGGVAAGGAGVPSAGRRRRGNYLPQSIPSERIGRASANGKPLSSACSIRRS